MTANKAQTKIAPWKTRYQGHIIWYKVEHYELGSYMLYDGFLKAPIFCLACRIIKQIRLLQRGELKKIVSIRVIYMYSQCMWVPTFKIFFDANLEFHQ